MHYVFHDVIDANVPSSSSFSADDHPTRRPQAAVGDFANTQFGNIIDFVIIHRTLAAAYAPDIGDVVVIVTGIVGFADLGSFVRVAAAVDGALVLFGQRIIRFDLFGRRVITGVDGVARVAALAELALPYRQDLVVVDLQVG